MTRLQPEPAKLVLERRLPHLQDEITPQRALYNHGLAAISDLRVVSWVGKTYYQVTLPGAAERSYYAVADGAQLPDGDRHYAEYLAREFAGETEARVREARIIESFDWEYPRINRLLPVWRIEFERDDALRAYVDTRTARLGTLVDRVKAFSSVEFALLHSWQWLDPFSPAARIVVMSLLLLAALGVTLSGCWIYLIRWDTRLPGWNLRRVHRLWGISISLVSLMFVLSGAYHLWHMAIRGDSGERVSAPAVQYSPAALRIAPGAAAKRAGVAVVESVSLAQVEGETFYRVQPGATPTDEHHASRHHQGHVPEGKATPGRVAAPPPAVFISASDGQLLPDGAQRHALETERTAFSSTVDGTVSMITEFGPEYGFAFKRLPVYRVPCADGTRVFVDPADGQIAAVIDASDRIEGWIFGYIHKLDWLVPYIGTDTRDAVAMMLALLLAGAAVLGLSLFWQRRRLTRKSHPGAS
jgi:hypothetical protein